jgi:hypothetical protein
MKRAAGNITTRSGSLVQSARWQALTGWDDDTTDQHHGFNVKRAAKLQALEEMAAKLIATARELPPGQEHHNALQEIGRFLARIAALKRRRFTATTAGADGEDVA